MSFGIGTILSAGGLSLISSIPLIVICIVLCFLFVIFKIFRVSVKILWRLLVNGLIGAGLLLLFDVVFATYLSLDFFYIPITWPSALVAGILGIPGVLLLLVLKFIL